MLERFLRLGRTFLADPHLLPSFGSPKAALSLESAERMLAGNILGLITPGGM